MTTITTIENDVFTDIHGNREYADRFIAIDEDGLTVWGCGESPEAALENVAFSCQQAGLEAPEYVIVWDQGE